MSLCQLFIQPEAAYSSVAELGEAGSVQFRDVSTSDHLPFSHTFETDTILLWRFLLELLSYDNSRSFLRELAKTDQFLALQMQSYKNSSI
jgi:hypothetical protein